MIVQSTGYERFVGADSDKALVCCSAMDGGAPSTLRRPLRSSTV